MEHFLELTFKSLKWQNKIQEHEAKTYAYKKKRML
jgi:hypothetical protein